MTGLIANGNRNNEEVVITSDSFFPGISSKEIREALRIIENPEIEKGKVILFFD